MPLPHRTVGAEFPISLVKSARMKARKNGAGNQPERLPFVQVRPLMRLAFPPSRQNANGAPQLYSVVPGNWTRSEHIFSSAGSLSPSWNTVKDRLLEARTCRFQAWIPGWGYASAWSSWACRGRPSTARTVARATAAGDPSSDAAGVRVSAPWWAGSRCDRTRR